MGRIIDTTESRAILLAKTIVIIVACVAAYWPAIKGGFIWDDDMYVTGNELLTAPDGLYRIWLSTDSPSQYFPLTYTTFWVEHKLWGFNPMGYHAVNTVIHIINALLLWLVLRRLSIPGAWLASAVFALHPVHVESVAWITERKNVLMLFFSLLTVLCWVEFAIFNRSGRKAILLYAGSLLFYALALFSKTTACTLPAALVLILWFKRSPLTAKRWLQVVPFVAMGIGMGILVMWWEKHHQGTGFVNLGLGPAGKLLIAGRALWFYLWKLVWPVNLAFSYPRWHIDPADIWQYGWPLASILALACVWLWRKRLGRATAAAALFFVVMLFPMLSFFPLYTFIYTFVADHYQYAASIGPIALVTAGMATMFSRSGKNARVVILSAAGVLLVTLGVLTWRQCRVYTSADTLWQDTLRKNPDSWLAQGHIGEALYRQGKYDEALAHIQRALELSSYVRTIQPPFVARAYLDLGLIYEAKSMLGDAAQNYQKSLEIAGNVAIVHYRLAEVLARQGNIEQALPHYNRAIEIARIMHANDFADEVQRRMEAIKGQGIRNPK